MMGRFLQKKKKVVNGSLLRSCTVRGCEDTQFACCCALNRDIFFFPGTSRAPPDEGTTVGGRVGRLDCDGGNDGESITAVACGGGNDGESMIAVAIGTIGGCGTDLRSKTVSLIAGTLTLPSRGPSAFVAARVRGGAAARTSLNFESFCWYWRAGAGAGADGVGGGAP